MEEWRNGESWSFTQANMNHRAQTGNATRTIQRILLVFHRFLHRFYSKIFFSPPLYVVYHRQALSYPFYVYKQAGYIYIQTSLTSFNNRPLFRLNELLQIYVVLLQQYMYNAQQLHDAQDRIKKMCERCKTVISVRHLLSPIAMYFSITIDTGVTKIFFPFFFYFVFMINKQISLHELRVLIKGLTTSGQLYT